MSFHSAPQYRPARLGRRSYAPLVLAGAAFAVTAWLAWERLRPTQLHVAAAPRTVTPRGALAGFEDTAISIFEENSPSVVHITSQTVVEQPNRFGRLQTAVQEGSGTGFVWDERGYIVTNFHVIQRDQSRVRVRIQGLRELDAVVVGSEPSLDIAVIKVVAPPDGLRPIPIGSSSDLQVGQAVFAIGNPFGLDHSLTTGVVSALDRVIESPVETPIQGVIQVDAAINPGNSGGPLLDSAGRLIGMNTSIVSPSGANAGIGFAVPIDTINRVAPRLISGDDGLRPALGINARQVTLNDGRRRVLVLEVLEGSGAAEGGLRPTREDGNGEIRYGDVLLAVDGIEIDSVEDIHGILDQRDVGDTIKVRVLRLDDQLETELDIPLRSVTQR